MKTISGGLLAKDGIHIRCERCGAEYMLENKYDFIVEIETEGYFDEEGKYKFRDVVQYSCKCPECDYDRCFGYEQFWSPNPIFSRDDWNKRYRVSKGEIKLLPEYHDDIERRYFYQLKEKKRRE